MISEHDVVARLREVAEETKACVASPGVEQRVLQSFRSIEAVHEVRQPRVAWLPTAAVSFALLFMTVALVMQTRQTPVATNGPAAPSDAAVADALDGFVLVPGASSLPPLESASIVRYDMPLTTLRAYGLDIVPEPNRLQIHAELLIGQDGYARAIRLMQTP